MMGCHYITPLHTATPCLSYFIIVRISTRVEGEEEADQELDIFTPVTSNPAEEPNTVALLMREGVRRRGVTRL